jgi:hypothetical protein
MSGGLFIIPTVTEISVRNRAEQKDRRSAMQLQQVFEQIRKFGGFLPICASCKKIRDDDGRWQQLEAEVLQQAQAEFSHGICPECAQRLYPQYFCREREV